MGFREFNKKETIKYVVGLIIIVSSIFFFTGSVIAVSDDDIAKVLIENSDIFVCNTIFTSAIRAFGWAIIGGLTKIAAGCAELFDNAFRFIDFTELSSVQNFITSFKTVFIALVCASLVFLGIILIFWHEKKPKLAMNICLAVLVATSSTYLIKEMNTFIASDVRRTIISSGNVDATSRDMVYSLVGSSIYDLLYLDNNVPGGLMNLTVDNRVTFDAMTEKDAKLLDINEIAKPEDVQNSSQDLMGKKIHYYHGATSVGDIYNGVAWTDLLNEYYYRYNVSWFNCIIVLISISIVYICLAYKVIRILYEIIVPSR